MAFINKILETISSRKEEEGDSLAPTRTMKDMLADEGVEAARVARPRPANSIQVPHDFASKAGQPVMKGRLDYQTLSLNDMFRQLNVSRDTAIDGIGRAEGIGNCPWDIVGKNHSAVPVGNCDVRDRTIEAILSDIHPHDSTETVARRGMRH